MNYYRNAENTTEIMHECECSVSGNMACKKNAAELKQIIANDSNKLLEMNSDSNTSPPT